ncbi:hypothetical protein HX882_19525 [Pseudomonas gingeri]|uniref:Uncharacterized protein n=1 Tax=Pseudomonas gingeri TaxID=117681 RepID=A0A7Y7XEK8_9PSED|nr:hypothetical protein [Pseudomonas gingeri]NWB98091.1 hypothetical protein [Pseudomonas gingeri]
MSNDRVSTSGKAINEQPTGGILAWWHNGDEMRMLEKVSSGVSIMTTNSLGMMLAIKGGEVLAWDGNGSTTTTPVAQEAKSGVSAIALGYNERPARVSSLALKAGKVLCWQDYPVFSELIVPEAAQSGVTAIAINGRWGMALKQGVVLLWEINTSELLHVPEEAQSGIKAISIEPHTGGQAMALTEHGRVLCWSPGTIRLIDVPDQALSRVSAIANDDAHWVAIRGGGVLAWHHRGGLNVMPVPDAVKSGVSAIAIRNERVVALKNGGVIDWTFGETETRPVPPQALSGVLEVDTSSFSLMVLKQDP